MYVIVIVILLGMFTLDWNVLNTLIRPGILKSNDSSDQNTMFFLNLIYERKNRVYTGKSLLKNNDVTNVKQECLGSIICHTLTEMFSTLYSTQSPSK